MPRDPYAPPPRHRDFSGAVVRFAIIAALLGAAVWGYMEFYEGRQTASLEPPIEEQTLAESRYTVESPTPPPAPVEGEAPSVPPASAPASEEPPPPPTTTSEPPA